MAPAPSSLVLSFSRRPMKFGALEAALVLAGALLAYWLTHPNGH